MLKASIQLIDHCLQTFDHHLLLLNQLLFQLSTASGITGRMDVALPTQIIGSYCNDTTLLHKGPWRILGVNPCDHLHRRV